MVTITEAIIEIDEDSEGIGTLIVTDAQLLVQPAQSPQYHRVNHDTAHAWNILSLGDGMGSYTMHIVCKANASAAQQLLDRVFYAYFDGRCLQLWCDGYVNFIVNGEYVAIKEYGFEDGEYTQHINVYCEISDDQRDAFVNSLIRDNSIHGTAVVVRPDTSQDGYSVTGYTAS